MSYELVYRSGKGNNNYWTNDERFTRKKKNHRQWETSAEIKTGLPQMFIDYPTLFSNKNSSRFYIYDTLSDEFQPILVTDFLTTNKQLEFKGPSFELTDSKDYAIAIDGEDGRYYFSTAKSEFLKDLHSDKIRRWKDMAKAAATANTIRVNKKIWQKYPKWNPSSDYVINLRSNKIVWPSKEFRQGEVPIDTNATSDDTLTLVLLQQLQAQLQAHFVKNSAVSISSDNDDGIDVPPIDLKTYDAEKVFEAFCYLTKALAQRKTVNKALKAMDNGILQDYLHTVELADLNEFNTNQFVQSLQQNRLKRRNIKDLALVLNAIGDNIDVNQILRLLLANSSLRSKYHYRNKETGELMITLMNNVPDQ